MSQEIEKQKTISLEDALTPEKFDIKTIMEMQNELLAPCVHAYYQKPLLVTKGKAATLYTADGREMVDCYAGVCTVIAGHSHPKQVKAIQKQVEMLVHTTTLYPTVPMVALAAKMAQVAQSANPLLKRSYFVNSGSEANEAMLHIAKKHKGTHFVMSLNRAFHGRTVGVMSIGGQGGWRQNVPYMTGVMFNPPGYCYRCPFGKEIDTCDIDCAYYAEETIRCQTPGRLAACVVEPIQGVGGVIEPPDEYFKILYEIIHKYDGLFVSDEVQTGWGRTGTKFWGIEHYGVKPDALVMAKGMGSGFPIAGLITTDEITSGLVPKDLFATYGGNPVSSIAALANIEIILEENFPQQAEEKGKYFKKRLKELEEEHKIIGEVRGKGLMLGIEIVKDKESKEVGPQELAKVIEHAKDQGLFVGVGGLDGNVIRIKPPIVISMEEIDKAIEILDSSLTKVEQG